MQRCSLLIILALLFSGHMEIGPAAYPAGQVAPEDDEYAVYAALLRELYVNDRVKTLLIEARTLDTGGPAPGEVYPSVSQLLPEASPETIEDFKSKNKKPRPVKNIFDLKVKAVLLSEQETEGFYKGSGGNWWDEFYKKHPDSPQFITLSRVGFNSAMNQALVHVGRRCGFTCGEGRYVLLTKKGGVWKIEEKMNSWVS